MTRNRNSAAQTNIPLLVQNLQEQPDSLSEVLTHQCGEGKTALLQAASLIGSSRRVVITGMGASLFASIPFEYALCSMGIDAVAIEAGELLHFRCSAYKDSVIVAVSRSGASVEITKLMGQLGPRNTVIAVTNEPSSSLAQQAHATIAIRSRSDEMVAIQTYTGTLLTLYLLTRAIQGDLESGRSAVEWSLPHLSRAISLGLSRIEEWDRCLDLSYPVHLLARGPSCASALEGALLFNEVAKCPAIPMSVASFRHGPVEQVDDHFRCVLFAGNGQSRELNVALARDLEGFGGHVILIAQPTADLGNLKCYALPDFPTPLAQLFEIVPLQLAAVRMAQLRGVVPGSFRYIPQVALDEAAFATKR